jgi:hypothetical protein
MDVRSRSRLFQELLDDEFSLAEPEIFIRHCDSALWATDSHSWSPDRDAALRFRMNIDAIAYCRAANVRGVLTAFDHDGAQIYELEINSLLDLIGGCPGSSHSE